MKLISFSLFGTDEEYCQGALENARRVKEIYPGWEARFYVSQEIPQAVIDELTHLGADVRKRTRKKACDGMFWRFEAVEDEDVSVCLVRDVDSVCGPREKAAVDDWLASKFNFHIMRDHPLHRSRILGGMWGVRKPLRLPMNELITKWNRFNRYGVDQAFLKKQVYPRVSHTALVHSDFWFFEGEVVKPFPTQREGSDWVGLPLSRPETMSTYQSWFDLGESSGTAQLIDMRFRARALRFISSHWGRLRL